MSDHEVAPENPQNPNPGWQCNDIPIGMLVKSAIGTFAVVILAFVGMLGVHKHYNDKYDELDDGIPAWVAERALPEGDLLLQSTPREDLAEYENNSDELLNSYGWSDAEAKVARIPIADAKKHMLTSVFKTATENHSDYVEHTPAPHGHPDHNHATDHTPAKAQKVDAHGGIEHSEPAH